VMCLMPHLVPHMTSTVHLLLRCNDIYRTCVALDAGDAADAADATPYIHGGGAKGGAGR